MVRMTKCITVSTAAEKEHILNLLVENNIPYRVKMDNVNQSMTFSGFGSVNSVKISYTFYVKKDQVDEALFLIRGGTLS
ncbi:hypothetical protein [Anaerotignum lactatifermentans]|uniref:hypothetical protein n=1 Tax=Anaerotignum lactatifermentans TaxID=160404 RepID=UPI0024B05FC4|nr:hypothetical protein [Anaerotignum lactatifermentans]MBS5140410.1 hypothetical protein [Clostridium sp.]